MLAFVGPTTGCTVQQMRLQPLLKPPVTQPAEPTPPDTASPPISAPAEELKGDADEKSASDKQANESAAAAKLESVDPADEKAKPTAPPPAEMSPSSSGQTPSQNRSGSSSVGSAENADSNATADSAAPQTLLLADVIASSIQSFPQIEQARLQAGIAAGETTSARGFYDHKLQGYTLNEPTGFYENSRSGIGIARQLWWGGYLSAGYRTGRGDFAPWYKERETNKGGEFKVSMVQPLLQGRAIDPARVELLQANLRLQAVAPEIERTILLIGREGSEIYWQWLAASSFLRSQEELLRLAEVRAEQLRVLLQEGAIKALDITFNEQLVAERRVKVIETRQKLRELGIKLSFYLRDEVGQPLYPREEWAPKVFPPIQELPPGDFPADLAAALSRRPELRGLSLEMQQVTLDLRLAQNQMAPQLDFISGASQDMGTPASSLNDKGQFELEVGLEGEVPIQRRKAIGKIQSTRGKLAQLDQKIRLQQDKIGVELMTARNALDQAALEVVQAEAALQASLKVLEEFNVALREGQVDLIYINILETKVTEYQIKLVESRQKWFAGLAAMQAALGLDPLEQAINLLSVEPPAGN